jgi:hypothetical protein
MKKFLILAIMVLTLFVPTVAMADTTDSVNLSSEVLPQVSIAVDQTTLDFGVLTVGVSSAARTITLRNMGTSTIKVTTVTSAGFYNNCLYIDGKHAGAGWAIPADGWTVNLVSGQVWDVSAVVIATSSYSGVLTGTVTFVAEIVP